MAGHLEDRNGNCWSSWGLIQEPASSCKALPTAEKYAQGDVVVPGRSWRSPKTWAKMLFFHHARDTVIKDRQSRRDDGRVRVLTMTQRLEVQDSSCIWRRKDSLQHLQKDDIAGDRKANCKACDWTLWRGQLPLKWKKILHTAGEPEM
jgi:hypothetical protein